MQETSSEKFLIRRGWYQRGYELTADEFDFYNRVSNFSFLLLALGYFCATFYYLYKRAGDLPNLGWDAAYMAGGIALLCVMISSFITYSVAAHICKLKPPIDHGSTPIERHRRRALARWQDRPFITVFLAAVFILLSVYDGGRVSVFGAAVFGYSLFASLYFRYLSPYRP